MHHRAEEVTRRAKAFCITGSLKMGANMSTRKTTVQMASETICFTSTLLFLTGAAAAGAEETTWISLVLRSAATSSCPALWRANYKASSPATGSILGSTGTASKLRTIETTRFQNKDVRQRNAAADLGSQQMRFRLRGRKARCPVAAHSSGRDHRRRARRQ